MPINLVVQETFLSHQCVLQSYISDLLDLSIHNVYTPIFWAFVDYIVLIENVLWMGPSAHQWINFQLGQIIWKWLLSVSIIGRILYRPNLSLPSRGICVLSLQFSFTIIITIVLFVRNVYRHNFGDCFIL